MAIADWGISPSEYWKMSPDEVSLVMHGNQEPVFYGRMSEQEVDDLIEMHESGDFI